MFLLFAFTFLLLLSIPRPNKKWDIKSIKGINRAEILAKIFYGINKSSKKY